MVLGALYKALGIVCSYVAPPVITTKFLLGPPKVVGVFSAALTDYYSWKLGERIFGEGSAETSAVVRKRDRCAVVLALGAILISGI